MSWLPKEKVLVPIDFGDEAFAAIDVALELVAEPSGLHLLHVMPEFSPTEPILLWEAYESSVRKKHAADKIRERLTDEKYRNVHIEVVVGDAGQEIAKYAQLRHVGLIVMPSHGRSGLQRLFIGSVAERVTRLSHCPVLILRQ